VTAQNAPVGDLTGRVYVITGSSSGVGLAAAEAIARRGGAVILVGRDAGRLQAAVQRVREAAGGRAPWAIQADFARFDDVHLLADQLRSRLRSIDVLANNAGALVGRGTSTVDGFETTLQTNHLSPFLLTLLLRDQLRGGRIVNTTSDAHRSGGLDPAQLRLPPHGYGTWRAYGASKQANILFTIEATRRWPEILSTSFHPGVVRSHFGAGTIARVFFKVNPFLLSPAQGADTLVWLATAPPQELVRGGYYVKRKLRTPAPAAADPALAARLWEASLAAVGAV
jgi:NAD(P)-dependent dehydrogenase (short-subunit alcohol dehydrogenase family)